MGMKKVGVLWMTAPPVKGGGIGVELQESDCFTVPLRSLVIVLANSFNYW